MAILLLYFTKAVLLSFSIIPLVVMRKQGGKLCCLEKFHRNVGTCIWYKETLGNSFAHSYHKQITRSQAIKALSGTCNISQIILTLWNRGCTFPSIMDIFYK